MYSYGDDFSYEIDGNLEYFTCLTTLKIKEFEYIVAENEFGNKKVFLIEDEDDEIISEVDEDDEETILDIYDRQIMLDGEFYTTDDDDFNKFDELESSEDEYDEFITEEMLDEEVEIDDIEIDDILEELFNE